MKKNRKKFLSAILATGVMANLMFPCIATEIFSGGADGYGAKINDLGGANVNYNTGKEAQLGITGNGNTIKWDHLNVGAGNKLDFNFTQSGQVSVNKVINGVSKFAGTVSTSGEDGHLIISNPNGMVFMNGSVVNVDAGSSTFTTHDVIWDGQKNGQISTRPNGTKNGIAVGGSGNGPVPVFKVAKDLNIIAPGINISGADLFAGGTVSMYTNDGMTFTAGQTRPGGYTQGTTNANDVKYAKVGADGTVSTYTKNDNSGISLKNVRVAKADQSIATADGKIYLISGNGMDIDNLTAGNIYGLANVGTGINIKNSKVGDSTKSYLQTAGKLTLDNTTLSNAELGFSGYYSGTDDKYAPTNNTTIDIKNSSNLDKITVYTNGVVNIADSTVNNSSLSTKTNINVTGSSLDKITSTSRGSTGLGYSSLLNSVFNSGENITVEASSLKNSSLKASNDINTSNWTYFDKVTANAGQNINLVGGETSNNTVLSAKDINVESASLKDTTLNAENNITSKGWSLFADVAANAASGNITINPGAGLYGTTLNAGGDIGIYEAYLHSVNANAANGKITLQVNNASGDGDKTFNAKDIVMIGGAYDKTAANATNNVDIIGAGIYNSSNINAENNIYITYGANIQDTMLTAKENISVNGDTCTLYLNNVIASAINGNIDITSTGTGHGLGIDSSILNAGNNINVSGGIYGTALRGITANADRNVNFDGVQSDRSILNAGGDANIAGSYLADTFVGANGNIHTNYSQFDNNSFLSATIITMDGTGFYNSGATASENIDVNQGTGIINSNLFAKNELNLNMGSSYSNAYLMALGNINTNTIVDNSIMYAGNDINQYGGYLRFVEVNADGNINSYYGGIHSSSLTAGNDMNFENSDLSDVKAAAGGDININMGNVGYSDMNAGNNANLNGTSLINTVIGSNGFMNIDNFSRIDDSVLKSGAGMFISNSTMNNTIASSDSMMHLYGVYADNATLDAVWDLNIGGGDLNNSHANAGLIALTDNATVRNSVLSSVYEISMRDSNISEGSGIYAGEILNIENSRVNDSDLYATYNVGINGSDIKNTRLGSGYGLSVDYSTINDSRIVTGSAMINNSNLTNTHVHTNDLIHSWGNNIIASTLNTNGMLNMYQTVLKDSSASSGYGFLRVEYGSTVDNSHLRSDSNIHINDSIVNDSTVEAMHMYMSGTETKNSNFNSIGDVYFYNSALDNINIAGERAWLNASRVKGSTVLANDLEVMDSTIADSKLTANINIAIGNSILENIKPLEAGNSISITDSMAAGNLTANAGNNIQVNGLTSDANVKLMASDTIDIKNIDAKGTISALNANTIVADTIKGNLVYLGGRTKDKAQAGMTVGNSTWYEEWNPMASSIIANNIEADLDLRLLSTDKVVANNLKSGGDIRLVGNNVTASNISVTDQKIKTHYPSTTPTTGLFAQTYDSWAGGWGLANNEGRDSIFTLNNVTVADKSAAIQISAFETVKGENITTPIFIAESVGNMDINNLKTDDIHISNLYYTLFGNGYFDLDNVDIKGITALTNGRNVTINKSFNPDNFDSNLDKVYGYEHNLLVLQYLNGDYDKISSKAKNTNLALVNYIDGLKLDNGTVAKVTPEIPNNNNNPDNNGSGNFGNIQAGDDILYKLAEDLDTIFRKKFEPKSFAATDDEIEQMKKRTLQTINGESGLIKITSPFIAH